MTFVVVMVVRTIQKGHRVSIPPEMWGSLGLREGDEVEVIREGRRIVILPISKVEKPTEMLWSLSKAPTPVDQPDEVIEEVMAEESEEGVKEVSHEVRGLKRFHLRPRQASKVRKGG